MQPTSITYAMRHLHIKLIYICLKELVILTF